jgi:hypothetical protein
MTTAPFENEMTSLVGGKRHEPKSVRVWNIVWCLVGAAMGMLLMGYSRATSSKINECVLADVLPKSPYNKVQGLGFQIYTGSAPARLDDNSTNPECLHARDGKIAGDDLLQCYLGHGDPIQDVQRRFEILKDTVERAYQLSDKSSETLKIFIAPEFYWRGSTGAYAMEDDEGRDNCGAICLILQQLEGLVAQERFEHWLFVFGTIIASETLPTADAYDYLFYNFAPVYKGYNPAHSSFTGRRFLVPKRYVSMSDFLTPRRHVNHAKELVDARADKQISLNPFALGKKRYNNDMWLDYKDELNDLGYAIIEFDWLVMDGISLTIEVCFDHDRGTALNSYLADIITGSTTLIPSSSSSGLHYVHIPKYQAQISIVSSAGMTVTAESLALTHNGTIFLQDGLYNDTTIMIVGKDVLEFEGGTEAVQRHAVLTPTDVYFEHKVVEGYKKHSIYDNWKEELNGIFSVQVYEPMITVFEPLDIAKVTP